MSDLDIRLEAARSTTVYVNGLEIKLVTFNIDELKKLISSEVERGKTGLLGKEEWERQAVKDGWTQDLARKHFNDAYLDGIKQDAGIMTGRDWYLRFFTELEKSEYHNRGKGGNDVMDVIEAAKKTSGIDSSVFYDTKTPVWIPTASEQKEGGIK